MGDHAVTGRPDVREAGGHGLVDEDGAARSCSGAGPDQEVGVGAHADDDQDQVDVPGERFSVGGGAVDVQAGVGLADRRDGGVGVDVDAVLDQFVVDQGAEFDLDSGEDFGEHLDLGDVDAAHGEAFGHLQSDVAGTDDECPRRLDPVEGLREGEGVAHRVQQVHTIGRAELLQAFDRRPDRDSSGADDQFVVGDGIRAAVGTTHQEPLARHVDVGGEGVQAQLHAGGFEVGMGAVSEIAPVGDLAGDVVQIVAVTGGVGPRRRRPSRPHPGTGPALGRCRR